MGLPWLKADVWKSWDKSGRAIFVKECKKYLQESADIADHEEQEAGKELVPINSKHEQFRMALYLLVKKGCKGTIRKDQVVSTLRELLAIHESVANTLSDVFSELDEESLAIQPLREKFISIIRTMESNLGYLFLERLTAENLAEVGIVSNKKMFTTRFIRIKTKLYFKQQKYNLFREESEGYSKLIAELAPPFGQKTASASTANIQGLIGRFNLDPNRVLDIVLEAFECESECGFFIPLIQNLKSPPGTICEILGFKLQNLEGPSESLFLLIGLLLQYSVIQLQEIYSWLTPDDRTIQKDWDRELKDAKEYARKSMIVTINKDKEEDPNDLITADDRYLENQKFSLCEALLSIGAWDEASNLMNRLPPFACVSKKRIALKMINFINYLIDPLYMSIRRLKTRPRSESKPTLVNKDKAPSQIKSYGQFANKLEMIVAVGPYMHHDPVLIYKLLRIMLHYLESNNSKRGSMYYKFLTIFDEVILPSTCFLDANCPISEMIWSTLQYYPYQHRFRLYGSWKGEALLLNHPSLLRKRVDVVKKIKHLMRRISKENVKPMGRQLGKLAHSMPAVIFDYILSQVQLFDNLISPVIDALKFLTTLSYDVLGYCLLEALSPASGNSSSGSMSVMLMPNRPRTKHDGSTIASWLQNLSSFSGAICKKYGIELVPLLQYVANQLKAKQGLDLLLLKEVVQKMTGIEAAEDMTFEQLDAMAGGELLRGEAGYFGQVRSSKKSGGRLREAVSVNDLAITICILMAQQRNCIIYDESQALHTKLVGKLYDQCQDTLVQFGTFMANSCTMDDYAKKIPSLDKLVQEYHLSADVAFFLWRPIFAHKIGIKYDELRRAEKSHKSLTVVQRQQKYADAADHVYQPVVKVMRDFLPSKTWDDISPQFYVTFWSLSLYDLFVPSEAYAREVTRIKLMSTQAGDNKDLPSSKRKKEQERCAALIEKLQEEERRQREHVDRVLTKLRDEKDKWFASRTAKSAKNEAVTAFLQLCLFPRCIFTAPDALYCAHFVSIIHSLSTPNFSTLICFDRIFCDIIYTVTSCTENEANRYGRFLCALLGTVMKWHGNKAVFDQECASFPGFVTKFRAANTAMTESSDHVDYENFRHVCHKWHYKITKCIIVCLESKDHIQIRNGLIVLNRMLPFFPKVLNLAAAVEKWVERVRSEEKDKRQDLFALATSYIGQLKAKWSTLMNEEDFHQKTITQQIAEKKQKEKAKEAATKDDKDKEKVNNVKEKKKIPGKEDAAPGNPTIQPTVDNSSSLPKATNNGITTSNNNVVNNGNSLKRNDTPPHARPKEKELELDKVEKTIKKEKDLEVSPSSIEPHLAKLMEPGEVVSKSELVRRSLDSVDGIKESKRRKLDNSSPKEEKPKEKSRRVKTRDGREDDRMSNGTGSSPGSGTSANQSSTTVTFVPDKGPLGTMVTYVPMSEDKDKKREKKKTERKRDREEGPLPHAEPKRKRAIDSGHSKSTKKSSSSRNVVAGNGESSDRDRHSSKEREKSPRNNPSRDRVFESTPNGPKVKHSRYK